MSINTDHQLREQMSHDNAVFPITYFHDELVLLPNYEGTLHWHPEFEIATAQNGTLDFQIGQEHITLSKGTEHSFMLYSIAALAVIPSAKIDILVTLKRCFIMQS